ncbi:MAG: thermonuclease family protein [Thermoleophilia bacterium]
MALGAALVFASAAGAAGFTFRGTVVHVADGDTITVDLLNGTRERVRLLAIDAPERGDCFSQKARSRVRKIASGEVVTLKGDPTQDRVDRYGRLLAYVWLPGGRDLGYQLVKDGFATSYVFERPARRHPIYAKAEREARAAGRGLWGACTRSGPSPAAPPPAPPAAPPPASGCHPSYRPCVPDVPYDLDCADIGFTVRVVGYDEYRLDGDGDGYGCE